MGYIFNSRQEQVMTDIKVTFNKAWELYPKKCPKQFQTSIDRKKYCETEIHFFPCVMRHKNLNAAIVNSLKSHTNGLKDLSAKLFINLAPLRIYWSGKDRFYNWLFTLSCVLRKE